MAHQEQQQDTSRFGHNSLGCKKCTSVLLLAQKLNPQYLGYSPMMTALVGAIVGHDYGVRDSRGGLIIGIHTTSDGFVIASTTSHESREFIGTADDLGRNLSRLLNDANLTPQERQEFADLQEQNITDWRVR